MPYTPAPFTTSAVISANTKFTQYPTELNKMMSDVATYLYGELSGLPHGVTNINSYTSLSASQLGDMFIVSAIDGAITIVLPDAATVQGKSSYFKKSDATGNTITITSAQLIDGDSTYVLEYKGEFVTLCSDGISYIVIGE
jgi:hypothetical protein